MYAIPYIIYVYIVIHTHIYYIYISPGTRLFSKDIKTITMPQLTGRARGSHLQVSGVIHTHERLGSRAQGPQGAPLCSDVSLWTPPFLIKDS